jgi:hypothetical protein
MPIVAPERRPEMKIARILLAAALAGAAPAFAQGECSKADAAAAEKAIDRVVNSSNLVKAWKDYRHCDSGPVDELFTDAILRILVPWKDKDAEQIAIDAQADPEYKKFLHKHLRSDAAKADREAVFSRAKSSCPPIQDEFCKELIEVVKGPAKAPAPAPAPPAPAAKK